jgi:hypothetical protein
VDMADTTGALLPIGRLGAPSLAERGAIRNPQKLGRLEAEAALEW